MNLDSQADDKYYDEWVGNLPNLDGKVVAITGTTSGTGYWAAVAAVRKNAKVLISLNRKSKRADESMEKLSKEKENSNSKTEILQVDCDLMSFAKVRTAAQEVNEIVNTHEGLHVLCNNAGIMTFPDIRTDDGYDVQMQTNHLSHFLLTKLLMPSFERALRAGNEVRICQHSSGARFSVNTFTANYFSKCDPNTLGGNSEKENFKRYHMSKLSNSCFAMKLDKEFRKKGFDTSRIKSVGGEPGASVTSLAANAFETIDKSTQEDLLSFFSKINNFQSAADGALPIIEACFGENVQSGDFFFPEERYVGKPYKGISAGSLTTGNPVPETQTLSEENQDFLWKYSEIACGAFFE